MTKTSDRQQQMRQAHAVGGEHTVNEDAIHFYAAKGMTVGTVNEREFLWLGERIGSGAASTLNGRRTQYAHMLGRDTWDGVGAVLPTSLAWENWNIAWESLEVAWELVD